MTWQYFSKAELQCKCCGVEKMQPEFMRKLITLREFLGFPLTVTSAYRCAKHNSEVSSTGNNGPHTTGQAIDIAVYGEQAYNLIRYAQAFHFSGIGIKQTGPYAGRFVHIDDLTEGQGFMRPWVWGY